MAQKLNTIGMLIMLQLTLLFIEFLVGMYLNLFVSVSFPVRMSPGSMGEMLSIAPHMAIGALLFIVSVLIVAMSLRENESRIRIGTTFAMAFILLAGIAGYLYAFQNGQEAMSYLMAVGFILSMMAYIFPASAVMRVSGHGTQ